MIPIGIAPGHSSHPDNTHQQRYEHAVCRRVVARLGILLGWAGYRPMIPPEALLQLPNDGALKAKIQYYKDLSPQIALEVHLNAGGGSYSTAIFYDTPKGAYSTPGQRLAQCCAAEFKGAFPWKSIGARGQTYFGRTLAFLAQTPMPAVIVEAGFQDHAEQRAELESKAGVVLQAAALFQAIQKFLRV